LFDAESDVNDLTNYYLINREGADLEKIGTAENTFDTLNKDILLARVDGGRYDRVVQSGDFVKATGIDSLAAGVRIKLQTWFNELSSNPTYANFGNKAWFYLKGNNNALHRLELKETIKQCLEEMRRIKSVDSIELDEYAIMGENRPTTMVISVVFTSISDQTIRTTQEVLSYGV
jgi:hypothetical protein